MDPATGPDTLRARLADALARHDRDAAVRDALDAVASGAIDIPTLYADVLTRALIDLGGSWQAGETAIWEEHLATGAVRTIVEALAPRVAELAAAAQPTGARILLACPPGEAHDLGLRMLADRLKLAGHTVFVLGPDTPTAEIVAAARGLACDAIVLTSSTHFHRVRIRGVLDRIRRELPGVRVVVGGPSFQRDHVGFGSDEIADVDALLELRGRDGA